MHMVKRLMSASINLNALIVLWEMVLSGYTFGRPHEVTIYLWWILVFHAQYIFSPSDSLGVDQCANLGAAETEARLDNVICRGINYFNNPNNIALNGIKVIISTTPTTAFKA